MWELWKQRTWRYEISKGRRYYSHRTEELLQEECENNGTKRVLYKLAAAIKSLFDIENDSSASSAVEAFFGDLLEDYSNTFLRVRIGRGVSQGLTIHFFW